ncbi:MAG: hypothetical protein KKA73_23795, partial [Chloroflexi bacterium]|nr:hypothetical protein [Chloroflexota bacterium]
ATPTATPTASPTATPTATGVPGEPAWSGTVRLRTSSGPGVAGIAVRVQGRYFRYGQLNLVGRSLPGTARNATVHVYPASGGVLPAATVPLTYQALTNEWTGDVVLPPGSYQGRLVFLSVGLIYVSDIVEVGLDGGAVRQMAFDPPYQRVAAIPVPGARPPQPFSDATATHEYATVTTDAAGTWAWAGYTSAAAWRPSDPLFRAWEGLYLTDAPLAAPWQMVAGQTAGPGTAPGSGVDEVTIRYPGDPPTSGNYPRNDFVVGSSNPPLLTLSRDYAYLVWHAPQVSQATQILRGQLTQDALPLAGERVRVVVTDPGGVVATYLATTDSAGLYQLDAGSTGAAEFGTETLGMWTAVAYYDDVPGVQSGTVAWAAQWFVIHRNE